MSSILYYISILGGPLLAATAGSFLCLIPIPNVLEQPQYWYKEFICKMLAGTIPFTITVLIRTEYWSNLVFKKRVQTYMLFTGLSFIIVISIYITYLYYWNFYLELFQPMPLNHLIGGSVFDACHCGKRVRGCVSEYYESSNGPRGKCKHKPAV